MTNKALRIMIADPQHFQRLRLERDFNYQGYYAIAPVSSLEEMLNLLEYGDSVFDLVMINASLATSFRFNLLAFCMDHPLIRQAFIYDVPERRIWLSPRRHDAAQHWSRLRRCRRWCPARWCPLSRGSCGTA